MYCLIHHQGSRCINEYIVRGGVVLENVSSPLRFITKYIHFCLFNKINVIQNNEDIEFRSKSKLMMLTNSNDDANYTKRDVPKRLCTKFVNYE